MSSSSVSRSGIKNYARYLNTLAGTTQVIPSTSAMQLIETAVVGSGGATSVTFSNLGQYANTYRHLQIRTVIFSNQANLISLRINENDAAAVRSHVLRGRAGSVSAFSEPGAPYVMFCGDTSIPSNSVVDILDAFTVGKNKTIRTMTSHMESTPQVALTSNLMTVTDAITSIRIPHPNNFSFTSGSRFSLYGVK